MPSKKYQLASRWNATLPAKVRIPQDLDRP
jgi:hypothetical protein